MLHFSHFSCNFLSICHNLVKLLSQLPVVKTNMSSRYTRMHSKTWNGSFKFFLKMFGELHTPIGILLYLYLPYGNILVQIFLTSILSLIC